MITLKTLHEATAQEVFDQVAKHLLTQKKKSVLEDSCLYRAELDGVTLKCAAGCLISDDEYQESFEGNGWITLSGTNSIPTAHFMLIGDLQNVHDQNIPSKWSHKLEVTARNHNLEFKLAEYISSESLVIA